MYRPYNKVDSLNGYWMIRWSGRSCTKIAAEKRDRQEKRTRMRRKRAKGCFSLPLPGLSCQWYSTGPCNLGNLSNSREIRLTIQMKWKEYKLNQLSKQKFHVILNNPVLSISERMDMMWTSWTTEVQSVYIGSTSGVLQQPGRNLHSFFPKKTNVFLWFKKYLFQDNWETIQVLYKSRMPWALLAVWPWKVGRSDQRWRGRVLKDTVYGDQSNSLIR